MSFFTELFGAFRELRKIEGDCDRMQVLLKRLALVYVPCRSQGGSIPDAKGAVFHNLDVPPEFSVPKFMPYSRLADGDPLMEEWLAIREIANDVLVYHKVNPMPSGTLDEEKGLYLAQAIRGAAWNIHFFAIPEAERQGMTPPPVLREIGMRSEEIEARYFDFLDRGSGSRSGDGKGGGVGAHGGQSEMSKTSASEASFPAVWKKGDLIGGKYEVHSMLGAGGFGLVYLVFVRDIQQVCALKTFRDELLPDPAAREAFKKEALAWVNLEIHPFIIAAGFVDEVSGRLLIAMEPIAPDSQGRVSLTDHLVRSKGPLETDLVLKWALQFCLGIEHALAHGILCHRDIKPANILITQDGTLKISDFGLAIAGEVVCRTSSGQVSSLVTGSAEAGFGYSVMQSEGKLRCGTPGYFAPEVYRCEAAGVRSDIYSFGLVLWQMVTGSPVPPWSVPWRGNMDAYLHGIYEQQMKGHLPGIQGLLEQVIQRCTYPNPEQRFAGFDELREALELIWKRRTGRSFKIPLPGEKSPGFWCNKGASLVNLARHEDAIRCFDEALRIDPRCAIAWSNKGNALEALGRLEEAITHHNRALAIDPQVASFWAAKGNTLQAVGRSNEAITCYDKALALTPRDGQIWNNKGGALLAVGRNEEAIPCFDKALASDPRSANAWNNRATALDLLGQHEEAIACCEKALAIEPLFSLGWMSKGNALQNLGRWGEAIDCFDQAQALDPRDARPCYNKGNALQALGRHEEAISCYDKALAIDPRDARIWCNKGLSEETTRRWRDAVHSYRKFIETAPAQYAQQVAAVRQRIHLLESKGM